MADLATVFALVTSIPWIIHYNNTWGWAFAAYVLWAPKEWHEWCRNALLLGVLLEPNRRLCMIVGVQIALFSVLGGIVKDFLPALGRRRFRSSDAEQSRGSAASPPAPGTSGDPVCP